MDSWKSECVSKKKIPVNLSFQQKIKSNKPWMCFYVYNSSDYLSILMFYIYIYTYAFFTLRKALHYHILSHSQTETMIRCFLNIHVYYRNKTIQHIYGLSSEILTYFSKAFQNLSMLKMIQNVQYYLSKVDWSWNLLHSPLSLLLCWSFH